MPRQDELVRRLSVAYLTIALGLTTVGIWSRPDHCSALSLKYKNTTNSVRRLTQSSDYVRIGTIDCPSVWFVFVELFSSCSVWARASACVFSHRSNAIAPLQAPGIQESLGIRPPSITSDHPNQMSIEDQSWYMTVLRP